MAPPRKVLVVGSGGREHALALWLLESPSVTEVIVCPGNAGTTRVPPDLAGKVLRSVGGDPLEVALTTGVDLVVVGPEVPLTEGLADRVRAAQIPCYGPSARAAELEGSKAMMKAFCSRHGIRTAVHRVVEDVAQLDEALAVFSSPPVVKADGLCAGKGVVVAESFDEAKTEAERMLSGQAFGEAGRKVVLEERLLGAEASVHAICDGERFIVLPAAQDHKRIFDGDRGPNTGGMGTYAPAPLVNEALLERIGREVIAPVVAGMRAEGMPFVGTLFAGLMVSPEGEPVVLEYNVRFGDPETQVLARIMDGDIALTLLAAAEGRLEPGLLRKSARHALCVVLAAHGYPGTVRTGDAISGLGKAEALPGVRVLHAGTRSAGDQPLSAGGRVLGVSATGATLRAARDAAYEAAAHITFDGMQLRRDIGHRALP